MPRLLALPLLLVLAATSARAEPPAERRGALPRVLRNVEYARVGERSLRLDLYRPRPSAAPAPVVLWIHGGGWRMGTKAICPIAWLRTEGFAVASVAYRFSQEAHFPAQLHDVKAAVRYLRANATTYGLDGARIGAAGASAGGHLAALLGTTADVPALEGTVGNHLRVSSRVRAVYDQFGPTDLLRIHKDANREGVLPPGIDAVAKLLGGTVREMPERAALASPLTHASAGDAAFLIVQGEDDPLVPLAQSVRLHQRLRDVGVPSTLQVLPNVGHGGLAFFSREERARMLAFFRRHLGEKAPTATTEAPNADARIRKAARRGPFEVRRTEMEVEDAARDAPLPLTITWPATTGRHPVLIFSHGLYGSRNGYRPLVEHWASHGWVVIQPTHEDSLARRSAGPPADRNPFRSWRSRVADVTSILDTLGALRVGLLDYEGAFDTERIAVGGHSFGAHTSQLLAGATTRRPGAEGHDAHADPRPKAFLLISPQGIGDLLDETSWKTMTRPVMVVTGTEDTGRGGQDFLWRTDPFVHAPPGDKYLALLVGADHGFGGISGARRPGIERDPAMVDRVRAVSLLFLEAHVRGDDGAAAALEDEALRRVLGDVVRFGSR